MCVHVCVYLRVCYIYTQITELGVYSARHECFLEIFMLIFVPHGRGGGVFRVCTITTTRIAFYIDDSDGGGGGKFNKIQ